MRGRTDGKSGIRHLLEVDLWEISVVTFPMLPEARIEAVKGGAMLLAAIHRANRGDADSVSAGRPAVGSRQVRRLAP